MSASGTLISGTVVFAVLGLAACFASLGLRMSGKLNSHDSGACCLIVAVATVGMWIAWICAWLHQWHPLILPIPEE